jgi:hypothetical protein
VLDLAIDLQHELTMRRQHRLAIPAVILSAAARSAGLIVLHHDADSKRVGSCWRRRTRVGRPEGHPLIRL